MQFREFLAILGRRWLTIAASTLIVLAAAAAATLSIPPTYTATARVFFSAESPETEDGAAGGTYVITSSDLTTYVEVVSSPVVRDPLRTDLGLTEGFGLAASIPGGSPMLDITATAGDAATAAEIANAAGPTLAEVAGDFSPLLANAGQSVTATALSPARIPGSPSSPDIERNLLLGALTGLMLGVGLALARQGLDTKVRSESDIKALSDRPILGVVPFSRASRQDPLVMETDPHGPHAEALRRLRTNLLFVDVTTRKHSFVVTSAVPGEGKTTTAVNLALAMADAGSRVLLVDADLRNPSVASTMGLEGSVGLTTILLGRATADDVVQRWKDTSLQVLPAGQIPPNPSELLGSEAMATLFRELSAKADFVIVDSPPVVPVIDAVLLTRLTGGALLVVGANRTRKRHVSSALEALETVGAPVSGFSLNMVQGGSRDGYYGYHRYGSRPTEGRTVATDEEGESTTTPPLHPSASGGDRTGRDTTPALHRGGETQNLQSADAMQAVEEMAASRRRGRGRS
ncbi:polysaccharide biosynthesis tyrosine autokinase [Georgenia sp. M64]|uniref:polysaccharide biosynthesis tyrosine autokinase n=1 Tax=Georgenia sp. M64 TaxID=3120520 RepID=UPI0030DFB21D